MVVSLVLIFVYIFCVLLVGLEYFFVIFYRNIVVNKGISLYIYLIGNDMVFMFVYKN